MKTKNKLNCYVFSNLIIGFLSLNLLTTNHNISLVEKNSNNTLNKIYEKNVVESISTPDTIISSEEKSNVISISNKTVQSGRTISYEKPSYNSLTGSNLVNYAKKFIGLPYVHAGRSLATGTDCSGFTRLIYQEFGISLGTTVSSQIYSGTYVSRDDLEPGDLVFYSYGSVASHVAIYLGNGLIIHESNPRDGVKISSVNIMNYITARRLITSNVVSNNNVSSDVVSEEKVETSETTNTTEINDTTINSSDTSEVLEPTKEENKEIKSEEIIEEVITASEPTETITSAESSTTEIPNDTTGNADESK